MPAARMPPNALMRHWATKSTASQTLDERESTAIVEAAVYDGSWRYHARQGHGDTHMMKIRTGARENPAGSLRKLASKALESREPLNRILTRFLPASSPSMCRPSMADRRDRPTRHASMVPALPD